METIHAEHKEQSRVFYLSSDDKFTPESKSNSDFVVYMKETIDSQIVRRLIVKDVTVPNVFPNIRSTFGEVNNVFSFNDLAAPQSAVIPEGQYTIDQLLVALKAAMDPLLSAGNVTITRDPITNKITWVSSVNNLTLFGGSSFPLNYQLGLSSTLGPAQNITAQELFDISGLQTVFIQSNAMAPSNGVDGSFGVVPILEEVSLGKTPFGANATRQNSDSELSEIRYQQPRNLSQIDISLVDRVGNKLPIGNSSLSLSVKVFY
jgi:hypothetical protein